jgi:Ca2+-binding RTX toxin-like protein
MRAKTKGKHEMGKRFAILIGVAAVGVTALGAQTGAQTQAPPPRGQAPVTCYPNSHKPATIVGTSGNDTLSGTPANDVIASRGGNDKVSGLGGNDLICGGPGKDTLKGGKGDDALLGQHGPDTLRGGDGKDRCEGGENGDTASKCEYGGAEAGVPALCHRPPGAPPCPVDLRK